METIPFEKMTPEQHAQAALDCEKIVKDWSIGVTFTPQLIVRMQKAAKAHRYAAVQKRMRPV